MTPFDWGLLGFGVGAGVILIVAGVIVYRIIKDIVDDWNDTH
jgi:hypothetical protein